MPASAADPLDFDRRVLLRKSIKALVAAMKRADGGLHAGGVDSPDVPAVNGGRALTSAHAVAMICVMSSLSPIWTKLCPPEQQTLFASRLYGHVAANRRGPDRRGGVLAG